MKHDDLTYTIIGFAYKVHNVLGAGFLESVYENALRIELEKAGVAVMQQEKLKVWYENQIVGDYVPDLCARLGFQCPPTHLVDT
jgi:GxxExxY protein